MHSYQVRRSGAPTRVRTFLILVHRSRPFKTLTRLCCLHHAFSLSLLSSIYTYLIFTGEQSAILTANAKTMMGLVQGADGVLEAIVKDNGVKNVCSTLKMNPKVRVLKTIFISH